jgi:maleate cis-trans isomerase
MAATTPPRLGIVMPDDPIPSELHCLDLWLKGRGRRDVTATTILSRATGGHVEADLYQTGNLEVIAPIARKLADQSCGAVVWACTSGSFIGGLAWARQQARGLEEAAGVPATSTTLAFVAALAELGVTRAHLMGAYPEPVTGAFQSCLGEAGVSVRGLRALGTPDGPASFRLDLRAELAAFAAILDGPPDQPILIPDTAINSLDLVDELERSSGRPVLTANQVSLWHGLRLLGVSAAVPRAGRLLQPPPWP